MGKIHFTKMHGCGNDYIYVNAIRNDIPEPSETAILLSDRHKGIGSDGLVLIGKSPIPEADFTMRIFNADGSEAMMCGNASRCIGKYVYERGLTEKTILRLLTPSGIKVLMLNVENDSDNRKVESITVDMGEPVFEDKELFRPDLSHQPSTPSPCREGIEEAVFVSMGNPHYVVFVDDVELEIEAEKKANGNNSPVTLNEIIAKIEENKKKYKSLADEYEKPDNKVYSTDLAQEAFKRLPDLKTKENQEQDPEYQAKLQKQIKKMEKVRLKQAKEDRLKLERDYKKQLQEAVDDLSNVKEKNIFERILHFLFGFFEEDYNKYDEAINTIRKVNTFLGVDEKNASIVDNAVKNAEDRLFIDEENRAKIQYQVKISLDDIGSKRARQ